MKIRKVTAVAVIAILIVLCFTLSACDPGTYHLKNEDLEGVTSIELINYDNPEQKHFLSWVPDHTSDLKPFDNSKMSLLETLDDNRITDFVDDLCKCKILFKYYAYDSPNDICIKLNYSNGDFIIVWSNYQKNSHSGYIGKFSIDGTVAEFFGCFSSLGSYENLVNNYFQTQI